MIPPPGAPEAIEWGYNCDPEANRHGEGCIVPAPTPELEWTGPPVFQFNPACPLHGDGDWEDMNQQVAEEAM